MDKLMTNRNIDYYCGNGIANEVVADFVVRKSKGTPKILILSDREVSGYYYNRFEEQFLRHNIKPVLVSVDCKNNSKSLATLEVLIKNLVEFDFGREDWLIAFGGGGVLDVCGFAASLFGNGINLLAVPTTLTSMTEGALAKESFLNSAGHKNELRAGFKPEAVIVDPMFLRTVPPKIKANGYASVIRIALLGNIDLIAGLTNAPDFRVFINNVYKTYAAIEAKDPALLTLGCELADSIESYFRFMNYSEGEALALSILSVFDDRRRKPLEAIFGSLGLPLTLTGCTQKMIIKSLNDGFAHKGLEKVVIADLDCGKWKTSELSIPEVMEILTRRLNRITV